MRDFNLSVFFWQNDHRAAVWVRARQGRLSQRVRRGCHQAIAVPVSHPHTQSPESVDGRIRVLQTRVSFSFYKDVLSLLSTFLKRLDLSDCQITSSEKCVRIIGKQMPASNPIWQHVRQRRGEAAARLRLPPMPVSDLAAEIHCIFYMIVDVAIWSLFPV